MSDPVKYVFIVTARNDGETEALFEVMASLHVRAEVQKYNKIKDTVASIFTPPVQIRFVRFNFNVGALTDPNQGDVRFYDHPFPAKGSFNFPYNTDPATRKAWSTDRSQIWQPLNDPNKFPKSAKMSIVDVYHAVRRADPGSVLDLSIYSHGFVEGPILVDTNDNFQNKPFPDGTQQRDPNDRDGRARTDFKSNMGEDPNGSGKNALTEFKRGFAPGGVFHVFGCNVSEVFFIIDDQGKAQAKSIRSTAFQVLHAGYVVPLQFGSAGPARIASLKARYNNQEPLVSNLVSSGKSLRRREKPSPIMIPMEREFTTEIKQAPDLGLDVFPKDELRDHHYATEPGFFGGDTSFDLTRPFTEVVKYAARLTTGSYVFAAASALPNVTCFGALPGTASDVAKGIDQRLFINTATYGTRLDFYKKYLGVSSDEKGATTQRNYGRFDAASVASILNHRDNG